MAITQILNPTPELKIPIVIPTKEVNAESGTQPVKAETKISECFM